MDKTYIEKLQGFLDYNLAFEMKARELLNAPKRDNRAVKEWFIKESDGYVKVHKEILSCLQVQKERGWGTFNLEAMMLHNRIQESMKEVQHLIDEIVRLPLKEREMQK